VSVLARGGTYVDPVDLHPGMGPIAARGVGKADEKTRIVGLFHEQGIEHQGAGEATQGPAGKHQKAIDSLSQSPHPVATIPYRKSRIAVDELGKWKAAEIDPNPEVPRQNHKGEAQLADHRTSPSMASAEGTS
jgi:hypothetical protein